MSQENRTKYLILLICLVEEASGTIRIPANCSQQVYDVIDITDSRARLTADKKRVLGLILIYNPQRGEYEERLSLGAV